MARNRNAKTAGNAGSSAPGGRSSASPAGKKRVIKRKVTVRTSSKATPKRTLKPATLSERFASVRDDASLSHYFGSAFLPHALLHVESL